MRLRKRHLHVSLKTSGTVSEHDTLNMTLRRGTSVPPDGWHIKTSPLLPEIFEDNTSSDERDAIRCKKPPQKNVLATCGMFYRH